MFISSKYYIWQLSCTTDTLIVHTTQLQKQASQCRWNKKSKRELHFRKRHDALFRFTWMAFASLHHVQARLSVFPLPFVSQCDGGRVRVWRPGEMVSGSQWGYLWFISGHSSKKPVDAASLSHPLCPSHCFSIGLPFHPWHPGKRCPALPPWPRPRSGHTNRLPAKRPNRDQSYSAVLTPPSLLLLSSCRRAGASTRFFGSISVAKKQRFRMAVKTCPSCELPHICFILSHPSQSTIFVAAGFP